MGDAGAALICTLLQNHGKGASWKHQSTADAHGSSLHKPGPAWAWPRALPKGDVIP